VGELPDIAAVAPWLEQARMPLLMMLPLVEAAIGQDSPYSALSASAIDPIYVSVEALPEFDGQSLSGEERAELEVLRAAPTVLYPRVRALKNRALRRCFERFRESGARGSEGADDLRRFREGHRVWLADYVLFRALKDAHHQDWWKGWGPGLRDRHPGALEEARRQYTDGCAYYEYVQWQAYRQLSAARAEARRHGVRLAGDLPFMVAEDSADVWQRQDEFRLDATVGVPPDEFAADGQDWGLPVYRWDVLAERDYDWLKLRGKSTAALFDLVRVDHVVGFYRTYVRPRDGSAHFFSPADEDAQRRQGEAVMAALRSGGADLVAEDLGVVPPWVRTSLSALRIAGYRVLRWEKEEDGSFRDPAAWPELSLATTGTHDTDAIAAWWDALEDGERRAVRRVPSMQRLRDEEAARFCPAVHEALLETVYGSSSEMLVLPVQDVFGDRERINLPGSVGQGNWSYRMARRTDTLAGDPRTAHMAELARRFNR
jgi:4-alpha-glucanotransferase